MSDRHLHAVEGGYVDQVKRLEAFRAEHPQWKVWTTGGLWYAVRARQRPVSRATLRSLLDELDRRVRQDRAG